VHPVTGRLWCVVNERDELGDNTPFEYATEVREGAFYGWPWYYIGGHEDPRKPGARPDLKDQVTLPDVFMQAHSAPLQIVFYQGGAFPADVPRQRVRDACMGRGIAGSERATRSCGSCSRQQADGRV
jgi:glucose/arabinose dehydrogenase